MHRGDRPALRGQRAGHVVRHHVHSRDVETDHPRRQTSRGGGRRMDLRPVTSVASPPLHPCGPRPPRCRPPPADGDRLRASGRALSSSSGSATGSPHDSNKRARQLRDRGRCLRRWRWCGRSWWPRSAAGARHNRVARDCRRTNESPECRAPWRWRHPRCRRCWARQMFARPSPAGAAWVASMSNGRSSIAAITRSRAACEAGAGDVLVPGAAPPPCILRALRFRGPCQNHRACLRGSGVPA